MYHSAADVGGALNHNEMTRKEFKEKFLDCNGDELKAGDKAIMTLKGLGDGQVEIVEHENQLQIYDEQMGYYPLIHALNRSDMVIERIRSID